MRIRLSATSPLMRCVLLYTELNNREFQLASAVARDLSRTLVDAALLPPASTRMGVLPDCDQR
jgi:hypothetical protein